MDGTTMEVDPPLHHSSELDSQITTCSSTAGHQERHGPKQADFELTTEQMKTILAFGKELQGLHDSLAADNADTKLKSLLQVSLTMLKFSVNMFIISP